MPELPEVETTLNGIRPYLESLTIDRVIVRERRLRWRIDEKFENWIEGKRVEFLRRRGKYIIVGFNQGGLLIHLGMSGSIRVLLKPEPPQKHDHVDLMVHGGTIIRFRDPRRFGSMLLAESDPLHHPRLLNLGIEPLDGDLTGQYLYAISKQRKVSVKSLIMDSHVVVGVGNIYASESLFSAGIHPNRACNKISVKRYQTLTREIIRILEAAIRQGGTTLQDFTGATGQPGYFEQKLRVYGRQGESCLICSELIKKIVIGQRSTYFCANCQK